MRIKCYNERKENGQKQPKTLHLGGRTCIATGFGNSKPPFDPSSMVRKRLSPEVLAEIREKQCRGGYKYGHVTESESEKSIDRFSSGRGNRVDVVGALHSVLCPCGY